MLQFFRINDPYRIIYVFLILLLIRALWLIYGLPISTPELKWLLVGERLGDGFTMYKDLYDHTGPMAAMVYKWLDFLFGRSRWAHMIVSTLLITLQAGIINSILLKNKAYSENTYLPAFFFVVLMSGVMDYFALSPQLMALTFVLLSLNHIFRRIDNVVTDELFIYSGIYLGLATSFYLPAGIFFILFLLNFILFSSAVARRLLLLVYAMLLVFAVTWTYFFWYDAAWDFVNDFFVAGIIKPKQYFFSYLEILQLGAFILGVGVITFSVIFTQRFTNYQQKMTQVMVSFFIAGALIMVITRDVMTADLVFFVPSISFFAVYYFVGIKKRIWRVVMPYLVVFGLVIYPAVWVYFHPENAATIAGKSADPETRLMGVGVPITEYHGYKMASPFLDDFVSKKKLRDIDYYDEASSVYEALEKSNPELIVDKWGEIENLFRRFPGFAQRYEQTQPGVYELKTSN